MDYIYVALIIVEVLMIIVAMVAYEKLLKKYERKCKAFDRIYGGYNKTLNQVWKIQEKKYDEVLASIVVSDELKIKDIDEIVIDDLKRKLFENVKDYIVYDTERDPMNLKTRYCAKICVVHKH